MDDLPPIDPATLARLGAYAHRPRSSQSTRTWTVDELLWFLDPNVPVTTIVARLGVSRTVVTHEMRRLRRAGFALPRRPTGETRSAQMVAIERDLRRGMWDTEAARKYGVTPTAIAYIRRQANIPERPRRWTEQQRDIVIANQHLTAGDVASLVGRTARAVSAERGKLIAQGRVSPKISRPRKRVD